MKKYYLMKLLKLFLIAGMILIPEIYVKSQSNENWRLEFKKELELFGHRNWILIVDAAYPLQSKPAIKTIYSGEDQLTVVNEVLNAIDHSPHVFAEVFLDREIDYVPEREAKGIEAYKTGLWQLLNGRTVIKDMHEDLISKVDEAAKTFNVLVIKTNMTIPYTSVFLRLNCGYWTPEQEAGMRKRIKD